MYKDTLARLTVFTSSPERVVLVLALIFGTMSAIIVPQMTVNDENAHLLKSYSLSTGNIGDDICTFPKDIIEKANSASLNNPPNDFTNTIDYGDTATTTCGSAGNYSPIMHLPQAVGFLIGKAVNGSASTLVMLGRLSSAVFYAFALYIIVRFAKHGKWVYVVVGLFPMMIQVAGSLSGDTVNNIAVFASIAYILNLFSQTKPLSRRQSLVLIVIGILLALTKTTNVIILLLLIVLPAQLFKPNTKKIPFNIHKWLLIVLVAVASLTTIVVWQSFFGSMLNTEAGVVNPLYHDPLRFISILYNTYINPTLGYGDLLLRGVIGEFSSFRYHLPTIIVMVEFFLLILALIYRNPLEATIKKKMLNRLAFSSILSLTLLVVAITLGVYSAWAILPFRLGEGAFYADGVQGRYFTAALVVLIPIGYWLRHYIKIELTHTLFGRIIFFTSLTTLLFYMTETILVFT